MERRGMSSQKPLSETVNAQFYEMKKEEKKRAVTKQ